MKEKKHYVPAVFGYDSSYKEQARRAGVLDKFHGYPRQNSDGKSQAEVIAYNKAYDTTTRA